MNDLRLTKYANQLLAKGFKGNGCGSGVVSKSLCWLAQKAIKVDLKLVWLYHDAEYSIKTRYKSSDHKILADSYAHHNINVLAGIHNNRLTNSFKARFAKVIHSVLVLYGSSSYWRK
jgi:hypothetical protein